jgi:AhpD family alkylhydroperoxidase
VSLVREIEWEACLLQRRIDPALEKWIQQECGRVPGAVWYFSGCPWIPEALALLNVRLMTRVHIDHDLADLVGLVVSQDNSCRYCYAAQRALLRILGFPQARISQLEQDLLTAELDPREKAALDFARCVSRSNPPPTEADRKALLEVGFSDMEFKELASIAALHVFFNRVSTLPALPPQRWEELPDRWYARLFRPVIARRAQSLRRREKPATLSNEQKAGPFSYLILALDGLALAGVLRRVLDLMWNSPVLSVRSKALVFAVVARALGCRMSSRESHRLLLEEGLGDDDIDEILSHLGSQRLDAVEAAIVPFARETVWYQAAQIQRRARQVREKLSSEQFLELIVVAAIANAVCRLGVVTGEN